MALVKESTILATRFHEEVWPERHEFARREVHNAQKFRHRAITVQTS
jgi:hypothetical protein